MGRGAWWAAVHGVTKSQTLTERLHFHFSLSCIGEGNGNPLQCSCLEDPRDGAGWWAAVYGVAQSWTRLKRLSSSSSSVLPKAFTAVSCNCQVYRPFRGGVYWGKTINFLESHPAYGKGDAISFWQWFPTGDDSALQGHLGMSGDIWLPKYGRGWGSGDCWHPVGKDQGGATQQGSGPQPRMTCP